MDYTALYPRKQADKIKDDEMGSTCSLCGEMINTYKFLLGKP
jgi:hypothetical protein